MIGSLRRKLPLLTLAIGSVLIIAGCARWQAVGECNALGVTGYYSGAGNKCVDAKLDSKQQELVSAIGDDACERVRNLNGDDPSPPEHLCTSARVQAENSAWREIASSSNAPNLTLDHLIPGFDSEFRQSTQNLSVTQPEPSESPSALKAPKPTSAQANPPSAAALLVPSGILAQSILTPPVVIAQPTEHGNNTLEIPVVVQPSQPPLDRSFVGVWCGTEQLEFWEAVPPRAAPPPPLLQVPSITCYSFKRSGNGVVFDGRSRAYRVPPGDTVRVVSQSAYAVSPREISVTTIIEENFPPVSRATQTLTRNFKLDAVGSTIAFTSTQRMVSTTLDFTPIESGTAQFRANQHRATPSDEALESSLSPNYNVDAGGGDVDVPGPK
jgi:hypothetical protein